MSCDVTQHCMISHDNWYAQTADPYFRKSILTAAQCHDITQCCVIFCQILGKCAKRNIMESKVLGRLYLLCGSQHSAPNCTKKMPLPPLFTKKSLQPPWPLVNQSLTLLHKYWFPEIRVCRSGILTLIHVHISWPCLVIFLLKGHYWPCPVMFWLRGNFISKPLYQCDPPGSPAAFTLPSDYSLVRTADLDVCHLVDTSRSIFIGPPVL